MMCTHHTGALCMDNLLSRCRVWTGLLTAAEVCAGPEEAAGKQRGQ